MKKILLPFMGAAMIVFSLTANAAYPGKKNLPGTIVSSITAKYPDARIKNWAWKENDYVIRIEAQKGKCTAWYTRDGSWVKTEKRIGLTKDLPERVRQGFNKSSYASWHIDGIKELTTPDGQRKYVLHIDDGNKYSSADMAALQSDYRIFFSSDGTLIDHVRYHFNSPNK
jgi:hypothetical protein